MEKKLYLLLFPRYRMRKILWIMRWNIVFVLIWTLQVAAIGTSAQEKVSLNLKYVTADQLFREIRRQTNLDFVYNEEQCKNLGKMSINVTDELVTKVLDKLLLERGFTWDLMEGGIILIKAQDKTQEKKKEFKVTGKVTDEEGGALPGVAILIKGTTTGVVTDTEGKYTILVPTDTLHFLVFSFLGMKTVECKIDSEKVINVVMQEKQTELTDVVVTGYQNIKREDATGAFSSVRAEQLEKRYSDNILESLEGRIPGLVSYNTGMNDNGEKTLSIRGVNTFTNNTQPLVVVDGLPIEGSIDDVNPSNIASIYVLKDAAAASIYGARASNGVIVITTKEGQYNKTIVSASIDLTISQKADYSYFNYLNGKEQVELESRNFVAAYADPNIAPSLSAMALTFTHGYLTPVFSLYDQKYRGEITGEELEEKLKKKKKNNFLDDFEKHILKNEFVQRYNFAVQGQMGNLSSNFVLNFKNSNTGIINTYSRNMNISYKGSYPVAKNLNLVFGTTVNMSWDKEHNNTYALDPFSVPTYTRLFDEEGNRNYYSTLLVYNHDAAVVSNSMLKSMDFNHLDELERDFIHSKRVSSRYFLHVLLSIFDGLGVSGQFQYEDIYTDRSGLSEAESYTARYLYNMYMSEDNKPIMPDGGILKKREERETYYTFRGQANFSRIFKDKHAVTALAGVEIRQTKYQTEQNILFGYDDQLLTHQMGYTDLNTMREMQISAMFPYRNGNSPANVYQSSIAPNIGVSDTKHNYVSYYANANYTYNRLYSIFASYRKDLTDLFGTDPKFRRRPLWSVGLSWNMQNETFMQEVEFINVLKLRASYGLTGNIDQNTSSYMTATTQTNQYTGERWSTLNTPPNDQLRWEKTSTINVGADFALWDNCISGTLDWYRKYSTDLLTSTPLDPSEGFTNLTINNGEVLNTGIELAINVQWFKGRRKSDFGWSTSLNMGFNKNKIKKVDLKPSGVASMIYSQALVEGRPIHSLYSLRYAGLDETGDILWAHVDGSTTKTSPGSFAVEDAVYSGAIDPKITLGFENEWRYRGFSLSAMFVYYGGHKMRAEQWDNCGLSYLGYGYTGALPKYMLNGWTPDNSTSEIPGNGLYAPASATYDYMVYADRFVEDADFIKLRNVTLGYTFPKSICNKLRLSGLKLRVQGNNLWTWTKNSLDIDPEANNPFTGEKSLKQAPSFTFSLNINF